MNIYDIAKLAGVSIATVSRVVNDSPKVSEKTKQKVREVMEEQNYIPNVFARGLGLNSMKTIGVVCPKVSDEYMARAVSYLESQLRAHGYDCILYCSGYEHDHKVNTIRLVLQKRIDALVLVGSNYAGESEDSDLTYLYEAAQSVPIFLINGYIRNPGIYCFLANEYQIVYDTVTDMIHKGKSQILFLRDSNSYSALEKLRGYEDALLDAGLSIDKKLKVFSPNVIFKTRDILRKKELSHIDAVIGTDDGLAVGAIKYLREKGIAIPDDVWVIGFNDSELAMCCEPELTSIDNKVKQLCKEAVDSMMQLLQGEPIKHKTKVDCELVKRGSTDF